MKISNEMSENCHFLCYINVGFILEKVLQRPAEVCEHRANLPIIAMEQEIMETIETNPVTVICGETGSGKTTQVGIFNAYDYLSYK